MRNITLAIDERLLIRARLIAKRRGTSLNNMVRCFLERLCGEGCKENPDDWLSEVFDEADRCVCPKAINWSRDELHRF